MSNQIYVPRSVRSSAVLTNSYVAGTVLGVPIVASNIADQVNEFNHLALQISFTIGSLTDARIKVEVSDDNVTFYQTIIGSVSGATNTISQMEFVLTATGNYLLNVNSENFTGAGFKTKYIKISAKGTGTVTNSLMAITAVVGVM